MSLLFFATPSDKTGKAIMQAIKTQLPNESVDFCAKASSLSEHRNDGKVAILVPADEEELIEIYSMQNLIGRVPVMLVLPNRNRVVEAMGHQLRPRLVCYRDTGTMEAVSKLGNIVKSLRNLQIDSMPNLPN